MSAGEKLRRAFLPVIFFLPSSFAGGSSAGGGFFSPSSSSSSAPMMPRHCPMAHGTPCSAHVGASAKTPPRRAGADTASARKRPASRAFTALTAGTARADEVAPGSAYSLSFGTDYTSHFISSEVVKWKIGTWEVVDRIPVYYSVGHLMIPFKDRPRAQSLVDRIVRMMSDAGLHVSFSHPRRAVDGVAAVHLRAAVGALDDLVGAIDVVEVLGRVFAPVCVGK